MKTLPIFKSNRGKGLIFILSIIGFFTFIFFLSQIYSRRIAFLENRIISLQDRIIILSKNLLKAKKDYLAIKNEDQFLRNNQLEEKIKNIEITYEKAVASYEEIVSLGSTDKKKTEEMEKLFALSLNQLSKLNYSSASATLAYLNSKIKLEKERLASSIILPKEVPINNAPPTSGYSQQRVETDVGTFLVSIVSADLERTKVIVDTASDGDCANDCPVLPLSDYVSRNGAFAGVNGTYFCPASYPSCAGKSNAFDMLVMNKDKKYLNSENNVYSTLPIAIFGNGWSRFLGQTLEWGRDTSPDAVIANYPLLLQGGNRVFNGDGDGKHNNRGGRSFIGAKDNKVYIGVVFNATVLESAYTLQTLGLKDALNLDDGGSTALWYGGYKAGPGRNIPNAVLFVRK